MSERPPVFVVFEGLDGAGKTTVARRVAATMNAAYLTTPSAAVRVFRDDLIRDFGGSQEAAHLFYLATVFAASREVDALIVQGRSVVLDRYLLSTQAYAEFRGSALRLEEVRLQKVADAAQKKTKRAATAASAAAAAAATAEETAATAEEAADDE